MTELRLPLAWQDWRITEELGEGAYGRVYRAEKENGGVKAVSAIKVIQVPSERSELLSLRREFTSDEELRQNLKEMVDGYANEIRAMYRLQGNTHIVSIQDHAVEELDDGLSWRICIRMEYLQSFDDYAMTHSFTREDIIRLGISLCEALDVCAGSGILHRDVKPENLLSQRAASTNWGISASRKPWTGQSAPIPPKARSAIWPRKFFRVSRMIPGRTCIPRESSCINWLTGTGILSLTRTSRSSPSRTGSRP